MINRSPNSKIVAFTAVSAHRWNTGICAMLVVSFMLENIVIILNVPKVVNTVYEGILTLIIKRQNLKGKNGIN